jgi:glycosyltransferase
MQFDLRYRIAADYDFMLRCLRKANARIDYVPQVFVRMRNGGASNRSLKALWRKSREDLLSIKKNGVGGVWTLAAKNLRKVSQFIVHG